MRFVKRSIGIIFLLVLSAGFCPAAASNLNLKIDVRQFRLDNGMLFLVVERHALPQVACRLAIRAGSALEAAGRTGIAHMLEHMMFKGTKNFGTLDYIRDGELQARIEAAYQVVLHEQQKRHPDRKRIKEKLAQMNALRLKVQKIYVPQAFSAQLGKNGAVDVNAFTTKDQTQFTASVPADMLEQWFSIISEQLFEPAWREFYVEKQVVQREWAYRYVNNPDGAAWLDLNAVAYAAHPYHNPTIGWKSDMEKFSTTDAMAFHGKYYNPTNAVCVLVGDVTVQEARRMAEIYFARYPAGRRAPEIVTREPQQQGPRKSIRYLKGARTPLVRVAFHGARMGTKDFYALDAMTMILSNGRGAWLTRDIVDKGLAVEAWAYNPDNRYAGMVIVGGSPNEPAGIKAKNLSAADKRRAYLRACAQLERRLMFEVDKMKTELVSRRQLQRIVKLNQRDFLENIRSNASLAGTLATLEVQVGWRYLTDYPARIAAVTPQDIRQAARKYIRTDNKTSVYVIPGGRPEHPPAVYRELRSVSGQAAATRVSAGDLKNHSIYPTPKGWKHPLSFQRHPSKIEYPPAVVLNPAGTRAFFLPDHELPLIDLTILVKAGAVDVAPSRTGLTDLLSDSMIRGGTTRYSPSELALVLDENAVRVDVATGEEQTSVHLSVLRNDWQKGLRLLQDILLHPRFDSRILAVAKKQELIGLQRQGGDAHAVAVRESMIWHFQGHPYGRDPLAGLQTIPRITRDNLKAFVKRYFVPSNMTVAVSGDIDRQAVAASLEKFFKAFPAIRPPARNLPVPAPTPPVLAFINKPGQVQSQVIMLLPSVRRTDPGYWKINLLTSILGGSDSLMYIRLRDQLGLVYSAGFYENYKWKAGFLIGFIGCRADKTGAAIGETVRIMRALRNKVPERLLAQKRLDALNSFVFNVDTQAQLVKVYARYDLRGEPLNTLEKIQDAFFSATRRELTGLARKIIDPSKIQIFVVADKMTAVKSSTGKPQPLEAHLKVLAARLGLPFQEIRLR